MDYSTANGNSFKEEAFQTILRRLERIERRMRVLEHENNISYKQSINASIIQRLTDHVAILGVRETLSARTRGVRLTWLLILFICFASTGYFVFKTCEEYFKDPQATKVKLVDSNKYEYPTILFCPSEWVDADKVISDGLSLDGLRFSLAYLVNYYVTPPPFRIDDYEKARLDFMEYYQKRGFSNLVEYFKWISLDSREFFYHCPFCKTNNFTKVLMSESVCYQIPMHDTPGHAPVVSTLDTLEVIVPDRTRGVLTPRSYWRLFLGVDLRLGESTRRHAEIYPNKANTIQFITHKFISAHSFGEPCISAPPISSNYSHSACVLKCYTAAYSNLTFLMTACSAESVCDNSVHTPNQTFTFYPPDFWEQLAAVQESEKGAEAPEHCYRRCPFVCERMIYTIDVQSHSITKIKDFSLNQTYGNSTSGTDPFRYTYDAERFNGSGKLEEILLNDPSNLRWSRRRSIATPHNLTRISFLNSAAVYGGVLTFREVSTYSFETMVGNIGGMLSLWLGLSVIQLIQITMFIATEWFPCSSSKRCRDKQSIGATRREDKLLRRRDALL